MTPQEIKRSVESMETPLTRGEKVEHWLNAVSMLFPFAIFGFIILHLPVPDTKIPVLGMMLLTGLFIWFLRNKKACLKLEVYNSVLTDTQFKQANQAAAKLNGWAIVSSGNDYFLAIKSVLWQRHGIKITAIKEQRAIYLNSMVAPSILSNPFTFGLNQKNKAALMQQYQQVVDGVNVSDVADQEIKRREEAFWNAPEWTFKHILIRIIGYGLSLIFILICAVLMYEKMWEAILLVIMIMGIIYYYIRADIKILREKSRRRKAYKKE